MQSLGFLPHFIYLAGIVYFLYIWLESPRAVTNYGRPFFLSSIKHVPIIGLPEIVRWIKVFHVLHFFQARKPHLEPNIENRKLGKHLCRLLKYVWLNNQVLWRLEHWKEPKKPSIFIRLTILLYPNHSVKYEWCRIQVFLENHAVFKYTNSSCYWQWSKICKISDWFQTDQRTGITLPSSLSYKIFCGGIVWSLFAAIEKCLVGWLNIVSNIGVLKFIVSKTTLELWWLSFEE